MDLWCLTATTLLFFLLRSPHISTEFRSRQLCTLYNLEGVLVLYVFKTQKNIQEYYNFVSPELALHYLRTPT